MRIVVAEQHRRFQARPASMHAPVQHLPQRAVVVVRDRGRRLKGAELCRAHAQAEEVTELHRDELPRPVLTQLLRTRTRLVSSCASNPLLRWLKP